MKLRDYAGKGRLEVQAPEPKSMEEAVKLFERRTQAVLEQAEQSQQRQAEVVRQLKHIRLVG
ncbi:MAG: hypothetical protein ACPHCJ_01420 [Oceanococcaceae bacterium]